MLVYCEQCGKTFEAKTKRRKFCSEACRVRHHRAKHGGIRYKPAPTPPTVVKQRLSARDVSDAVVQTKGAVAVFDAGRSMAPEDLRPLCSYLADSISGALREVGL